MLMLLKETSVSSFLLLLLSFFFLITNPNCIIASVFLFDVVIVVVHIMMITLCVPSLPFSVCFFCCQMCSEYICLSFHSCFLHHCAIVYSYTHTICTAVFSLHLLVVCRPVKFFFLLSCGGSFSSFISR